MKKIAASDSRQSVGLKWKLRKGLEENVAFKEDGTMEVGKNLEVDGNILSGLIGKATIPIKSGELTVATVECWVGEGADFTVSTEDDPYRSEPFLFAIASLLDDKGATPTVSPICTRFVSETDYDLCRTMEDLLEKGFIPNQLAAKGCLTTNAKLEPIRAEMDERMEDIEITTSKLKYQHTVTIKGARPSQGGGSCFITFTAYSSDSTAIVSARDLIDVFNGCDLSVSGMYSPAQGTNFGAVKLYLHGASTIADVTLAYIDPSIINEAGVKMSECGNLSFEDDVFWK